MRVYINDEELTLFNGATVLDAIRKYYTDRNKILPVTLSIITDRFGNSVAPDGELTEGNHLYIKINE